MKKLFLISWLSFCTITLYAQSLSPASVNNSGALYSSSGYSLSSSLGLVGYQTFLQGAYQLSQGFQQPSLVQVSVRNFTDSEFRIFPNPTSSGIFLKDADFLEGKLTIMNSEGRTVHRESLEKVGRTQHHINVEHLADGTYFLLYETGVKRTIEPFVIKK